MGVVLYCTNYERTKEKNFMAGKFGEFLRSQRRVSKKQIHEIAEEMGWTKSYLMEIETGRSSAPSKEKLLKLGRFLEINNEDMGNLLRFSLTDKKRMTLDIPEKSEHENLAVLLYREWDNFSEDEVKEINEKIHSIIGKHTK